MMIQIKCGTVKMEGRIDIICGECGALVMSVAEQLAARKCQGMRDILFRGKRKDNSEWETGSLVTRSGCSDEQVFITDKMTGYLTPVIPETVGQYIGAADKNGCKIFEGDVVLYFGEINLVEWDDFEASFFLSNEDDERCYFDAVDNDSMFIIGNIYDNPELLENNNLEEHKNG